MNRSRLESRESKVYLAGDAVDADFPGAALVVRTYRRTWKTIPDKSACDGRKPVGKPTQEIVYHVTSLTPDDLEGNAACAQKLAQIVRTHWRVETYHGKRDNGYLEDTLTRTCNVNIISALMVARTLGLWVAARRPGKTTAEVQRELARRPSELLRIVLKGGLQ